MTMGYEDDELFGLDNAEAWANMFPPGGGFLYLGEEKRRLTPEMFHSVSFPLVDLIYLTPLSFNDYSSTA